MTKKQLLNRLDSFTRAYLECALWSSIDENEMPLDRNYTIENLSLACLRSCVADCKAFQRDNKVDLIHQGDNPEMAGHCFWLNRNGHGAGFWDRGTGAVGQRLSDASKVYGTVDLMAYRGRITC